MEHIHKIFRFIDPPDTIALQQCIDAVDACFYPWERCQPELAEESNGLVTVRWQDTGQSNTGMYYRHWTSPSGETVQNVILLNNRYATRNYSFTMLHEAGHMVDDTVLRDEQKQQLVDKWHLDDDGRYTGYPDPNDPSKDIIWSHNTPHTHNDWNLGWIVSDADYYHRPNEAFADAFVACFAPSYFPFKRFAHWSDDYEGVKKIILSTPMPPPVVSKFPNDSVYRLYRAYFLREPDQGGYDYWKSEISRGVKLLQVSEFFSTSTEFRQRYGSLTNTGFVKLVYQNVLGRAADSVGLAHWVDVLNRGYSRGYIMTQFSESQEFINKINNERKL